MCRAIYPAVWVICRYTVRALRTPQHCSNYKNVFLVTKFHFEKLIFALVFSYTVDDFRLGQAAYVARNITSQKCESCKGFYKICLDIIMTTLGSEIFQKTLSGIIYISAELTCILIM